MERERKFSYPKGRYHFLLKTHFILMVLVAVLGILMLNLGVDSGAVKIIVFSGLLALIILIIPTAVSPLLTSHGVSMKAVTLRQGIWLNLRIPIEKIKSVRTVDVYVSPGIRFSDVKPYLYITNSKYANVEINLNTRIPVKRRGGKMVDRIYIDAVDADDFVESVMDQVRYYRAVKKIDSRKKGKEGVKVMQARTKKGKKKVRV